jgi:MarR family transcriptional regulator, organic hydroperoxide resistance regulator
MRAVDPSEELRYLILAAQREGDRALSAALRPYGLTTAQAEAVDVLRKAKRPLTVKEIGERLICEHGSPSRLMQTLVRKGLVERSAAKDDGRLTLLRLSSKGRTAAQRMTEAKRRIDRAIAPILERHDVDSTLVLLRSMVGDMSAGRALARRIADEQDS